MPSSVITIIVRTTKLSAYFATPGGVRGSGQSVTAFPPVADLASDRASCGSKDRNSVATREVGGDDTLGVLPFRSAGGGGGPGGGLRPAQREAAEPTDWSGHQRSL